MQSSYLQEFKTRQDIEKAYGCKLPRGSKILVAWYGYGDYCGYSFVLYKLDGKLYEVNGSHCSCDGLEGQWEPEETTAKALRKRKFYEHYDGYDHAQKALREVLNKMDQAEKRKQNEPAEKLKTLIKEAQGKKKKQAGTNA